MNRLSGWLLASFLAGAAPSASAQAAVDSPPPWIVPVLRLVSSTHVEPTTGVVLSASGDVLVPLSFGAEGDEIVVLDGGNDIVQNGRPARTSLRFPELGLKVLTVEGLSRAAAPLAAARPAAGDPVFLAAFPPAEQIEEGEPPLHEEARLLEGTPGLDPNTPLPNVTGALLDACDNLLAYSMAAGAQDMAPSPDTQYRWREALATVRGALGLAAESKPCSAPETTSATEAPAEEPAPAPATEEPQPQAEPEAEPEPQVSAQDATNEAASSPEPEAPVTELPVDEAALDRPQPAEPADMGTPAWWWLAGALLLFAAGLALHRWRTALAAGTPAVPASDLEAGPAETTTGPVPAPKAPPRAADARLLLRGQYADGRGLEISAAVSGQAVDLEIGRGEADLALDSRAVSRRHARIGGSAGALTLSDLGSANGSSINGIPCLEGEVMYLEAGDTVILGDVRFTVDLETSGDGES